MEQVLLKSRIGPVTVTYRPTEKEKYVFDWNFDNDFKCAVPINWWESKVKEYVDRSANLTYSEAFLPLRKIT